MRRKLIFPLVLYVTAFVLSVQSAAKAQATAPRSAAPLTASR